MNFTEAEVRAMKGVDPEKFEEEYAEYLAPSPAPAEAAATFEHEPYYRNVVSQYRIYRVLTMLAPVRGLAFSLPA